ncbi:MAG: TIGR00341 family protein [Planctomycetota bacterium]
MSRLIDFLRAKGASPVKAPESAVMLLQKQQGNSSLNARFVTMLGLACAIAALGLMADSAVVVIGAMLIAPLMKPITSLSYGIVTGNLKLSLRSTITLFVGMAITLLVSAGCEFLFELRGPTAEILSRTHPTLIDLGIAVAAGVAATVAVSRSDVADSLPGVAVAVSLVPPLCVTGIGLSNGEWEIALGSFQLYAVNLCAILLCAGIVFLIDGYGKVVKAVPGLFVVVVFIGLLAPSLYVSMQSLKYDDLSQETVLGFLREKYPKNQTAHPNDLREVDVIVMEDHVFVYVRIEAPRDAFDEVELQELFDRIAAELDKPLNLKIQFVLTDEIVMYPYKEGDAYKQLYGAGDYIPRR